MISLVLKPAGIKYPTSTEMAAEIDMKVEAAIRQGHAVEAIKMPYGYVSTLDGAGLIDHDKSFSLYKGMKILVNG